MGILEIALIALVLSLDAMAVTVVNSICYHDMDAKKLWAMPVFFGAFQSLMPLIGSFLGVAIADLLGQFMPYVTCAIFWVIGFHMLKEGLSTEEQVYDRKGLSWFLLLTQALVTSLDAFAVGVTFPATGTPRIMVLLIGAITFVLVAITMLGGKELGRFFGHRINLLGALVFFVIGIKAFYYM